MYESLLGKMTGSGSMENSALRYLSELITRIRDPAEIQVAWVELENTVCCKMRGFATNKAVYCDICALRLASDPELKRNSFHYVLPPWRPEIPTCNGCYIEPVGKLNHGDKCVECILNIWQKKSAPLLFDPAKINRDRTWAVSSKGSEWKIVSENIRDPQPSTSARASYPPINCPFSTKQTPDYFIETNYCPIRQEEILSITQSTSSPVIQSREITNILNNSLFMDSQTSMNYNNEHPFLQSSLVGGTSENTPESSQ